MSRIGAHSLWTTVTEHGATDAVVQSGTLAVGNVFHEFRVWKFPREKHPEAWSVRWYRITGICRRQRVIFAKFVEEVGYMRSYPK